MSGTGEPAVIPKNSRILLDTIALIYFLEKSERYSIMAEAIFNRIESGELRGIMANLVFAELLVPLYLSGKPRVAAGLVKQLNNFNNLEIVNLTTEISMEAARLRATYGLRTPDAIHSATAIVNQATGILTNDKHLRKIGREGISVWLFDDM